MANSRNNNASLQRKSICVALFGDEQVKKSFMAELNKIYSTDYYRGETTVHGKDTDIHISDSRFMNSRNLADTEVAIACPSDIDEIPATFDAISLHINTTKLHIVTYFPEMDIQDLISSISQYFQEEVKKPSQSFLSSLWTKIEDVKRGIDKASKQKEIQNNQPTPKGLN